MKKFLSAIALMLVAIMLLSVVPASAGTDVINPWVAPAGIQKYYATDLSNSDSPVINGEISNGEYGNYIRMYPKDRLTLASGETSACDTTIDDSRKNQPTSNWIDFYFAYDEDYIYIAIEDMGGTWAENSDTYKWIEAQLEGTADEGKVGTFAARNNYHFYTGFNLYDMGDSLSMQASSRGFDENKWFMSGCHAGKKEFRPLFRYTFPRCGGSHLQCDFPFCCGTL